MKICGRCNQSKVPEDFNKSSRASDGRQSYCRACSKSHYRDNSIRHKANTSRRNKAIGAEYQWRIWQHLASNPCMDCGEIDPIVLEFDHVRGKKLFSISQASKRKFAWTRVAEEIEKCDVRCANCHRRKTAKQFNYYATVAERMQALVF